jgi:hypothetical protein
MSFDRPAHPDFLVYWTGGRPKDIDDGDKLWRMEDKCILSKERCEEYLKRLEGILRFGLWLMPHDTVKGLSQICFTELKLSEARLHARRYGRLGIGFKRTHLFDRLGRPVVYHHPKRQENDWFKKNLSKSSPSNALSGFLKAFLKQMSEKTDPYGYECLHESEWRIIWSEKIGKELKRKKIRWKSDPRFHSPTKELEYSEFFRRPEDVPGFEAWRKENRIRMALP